MGQFEAHLLSFVKDFLSAVGYPGLFLLMAIEGFGVPIPSELTMPFSGFLASSAGGNRFVLPAAIAVGALGEVAGSTVAYALGYFGGRPVLERYGRLILVRDEELRKGEAWFARFGDWIVLVTRLLPAVRSFIALPAGVVRMPFWRFLLYATIGSAIWCAVLTLVGNALGQHWDQVSGDVRRYEVVVAVLVAALVAYLVYRRITGREGDVAESVAERIEESHLPEHRDTSV